MDRWPELRRRLTQQTGTEHSKHHSKSMQNSAVTSQHYCVFKTTFFLVYFNRYKYFTYPQVYTLLLQNKKNHESLPSCKKSSIQLIAGDNCWSNWDQTQSVYSNFIIFLFLFCIGLCGAFSCLV